MMRPISWCATPSQRHWPVSVSREPTMTLRKRCPNRSTAIHSQQAFFLNPHKSAFHPFRPRQSLLLAYQGVPFPRTVLSTDKQQRVSSSEAAQSNENLSLLNTVLTRVVLRLRYTTYMLLCACSHSSCSDNAVFLSLFHLWCSYHFDISDISKSFFLYSTSAKLEFYFNYLWLTMPKIALSVMLYQYCEYYPYHQKIAKHRLHHAH